MACSWILRKIVEQCAIYVKIANNAMASTDSQHRNKVKNKNFYKKKNPHRDEYCTQKRPRI